MSKRTKKDKRPVAKIDFKPYGAAIKAGRTKQKESRNKAADALFISPRYLANIENKGQHPSVQVFLELMSRYHISVDQILHGEAMEGKSTERMQFETLLDELTDAEIKSLRQRRKRYWMQEQTAREKIEYGVRNAMNR